MSDKVLVLDGSQRSALATTRSLGRHGVPVVVGGETRTTLAGCSRYCQATVVYPPPQTNPEQFLKTINAEVCRQNITVLLPMTDITTYFILANRDRFPGVSIPYASFEAYEMVSNKWTLYQLARELGINVPNTYLITNRDDVSFVAKQATFPMVMKPYRSKVIGDGKCESGPILYVSSEEEICKAVQSHAFFRLNPYLLQEYIPGKGQGVFALYCHGMPLAFFAHRRLREKPPSGGVSVLSESVEVDSRLRELAVRILGRVKWHGVAMVELKVTEGGIPYLIEVNARFWGSLQLAIDAGIDFPWLLYQLGIGNSLQQIGSYKVGIKNRWLLGDLDHLYLTIRGRSTGLGSGRKARAILEFMKLLSPDTYYEINRWDDLGPFWFEIKNYWRM